MNERLNDLNLITFAEKREVDTHGRVFYDIRTGLIAIKNNQSLCAIDFPNGTPRLIDLVPSKYIRQLDGAKAIRVLVQDVKRGDVVLVKNNREEYPRFVFSHDENTNIIKLVQPGGGIAERLPMVDELSGEAYHYVLQPQGVLKMPGAAEMYARETKGYGQTLTESFKKALAGIDSETSE